MLQAAEVERFEHSHADTSDADGITRTLAGDPGPGESFPPKGSYIDPSDVLAEHLMDKAKKGDLGAARLILERYPAQPHIHFALPEVKDADDAVAASTALLAAVASGRVRVGDALQFQKLLTGHAKLAVIAARTAERAPRKAAGETKQVPDATAGERQDARPEERPATASAAPPRKPKRFEPPYAALLRPALEQRPDGELAFVGALLPPRESLLARAHRRLCEIAAPGSTADWPAFLTAQNRSETMPTSSTLNNSVALPGMSLVPLAP